MIQAVESATNRLSSQTTGKVPRTQEGRKSISTLRKILLGIFGFFAFIGITSSEWVFVGFSLFVMFLIWAIAPVGNKNTSTSQNNVASSKIRADMFRAYQTLRDGGEINNSPFQGDEISWALGGLAEERTSKKLQEGLSNAYDIIDDIAILNTRGQVNANIDHLVLANKGSVMVDTKVWAKTLVFTQKDGNTWLEKSSNPAAWSSVSTCLYEASFLPETPKAIVFAVGGKAGRDLEKYASPIRITHYYERFDDTGNLQPCTTTTVLFVAQSKIVDTIKDLNNLSGMTTFSVEDYYSLENLQF